MKRALIITAGILGLTGCITVTQQQREMLVDEYHTYVQRLPYGCIDFDRQSRSAEEEQYSKRLTAERLEEMGLFRKEKKQLLIDYDYGHLLLCPDKPPVPLRFLEWIGVEREYSRIK